MLSDWLGRARSQIAPIGPGTPKSVDRHGGGLGSALKSPSRAPGPDYCGCMDISHVAPDAASTLMMERPGPKSRGAEPTRRRCQGLEVAPQTKAMTAPVLAQACGIGPAETCSPKPAATMPPNQRTEGPPIPRHRTPVWPTPAHRSLKSSSSRTIQLHDRLLEARQSRDRARGSRQADGRTGEETR